jgi:hypothetical protein
VRSHESGVKETPPEYSMIASIIISLLRTGGEGKKERRKEGKKGKKLLASLSLPPISPHPPGAGVFPSETPAPGCPSISSAKIPSEPAMAFLHALLNTTSHGTSSHDVLLLHLQSIPSYHLCRHRLEPPFTAPHQDGCHSHSPNCFRKQSCGKCPLQRTSQAIERPHGRNRGIHHRLRRRRSLRIRQESRCRRAHDVRPAAPRKSRKAVHGRNIREQIPRHPYLPLFPFPQFTQLTDSR